MNEARKCALCGTSREGSLMRALVFRPKINNFRVTSPLGLATIVVVVVVAVVATKRALVSQLNKQLDRQQVASNKARLRAVACRLWAPGWRCVSSMCASMSTGRPLICGREQLASSRLRLSDSTTLRARSASEPAQVACKLRAFE